MKKRPMYPLFYIDISRSTKNDIVLFFDDYKKNPFIIHRFHVNIRVKIFRFGLRFWRM